MISHKIEYRIEKNKKMIYEDRNNLLKNAID